MHSGIQAIFVSRWRWALRWRRRRRWWWPIKVNSSTRIIKQGLVFADPTYTRDKLPATRDQPRMERTFSEWSDCVICKSLNNKNIFDEFCILFWINRLNCLLCLNMFKKGSVNFMLGRTRNFGPEFRKSSQRSGQRLLFGSIWREGKYIYRSEQAPLPCWKCSSCVLTACLPPGNIVFHNSLKWV